MGEDHGPDPLVGSASRAVRKVFRIQGLAPLRLDHLHLEP